MNNKGGVVKKVNAVAVVKEKELVKAEGNSPAEMIRMAVSGKANLEQLKGLLDLQERFEANQAKKAYHSAMAAFKANPPKINKDKTVSFAAGGGKTTYNHASLANVTDKINAELSKYGLSASWSTKQNGTISVTCKITHVQGHSEETTLSASADTTGSKNAIQAIGSTITYLERYTLLALAGLATFEDDDGKTSEVEYISQEEGNKILDMVQATGSNLEKFLTYMGVENMETIAKKDYQKAIAALSAKAKKAVKA